MVTTFVSDHIDIVQTGSAKLLEKFGPKNFIEFIEFHAPLFLKKLASGFHLAFVRRIEGRKHLGGLESGPKAATPSCQSPNVTKPLFNCSRIFGSLVTDMAAMRAALIKCLG